MQILTALFIWNLSLYLHQGKIWRNRTSQSPVIIIIERDSGIGWAVAFIILAIAIGFGIIVFMDQQSMIEYKIERALKEMQEESERDKAKNEGSSEFKDPTVEQKGTPPFAPRAAGLPNVQL